MHALLGVSGEDNTRVLETLTRTHLRRLADHLGCEEQALLTALNVPLNARRLPAVSAEKLYRLGELYVQASRYFGGGEHTRRWLNTRRAVYGHRSPLTLALRPMGTETLALILAGIEYGVYT